MKRNIAMILATILMLTLMPIAAFADSNDKLIALTFDDGPCSNTKRLLDGLRERGVKCTFFLVGTGVRSYPELVKQMWLDGHQVACHTYDHPYLTSLTDKEIRDQLDRTDALLDKAIGFDQDYMLRPPYGDHDQRVLDAAETPCFFWSMDTGDWKYNDANYVYGQFLKYARDGSIALLHDTHKTSVDAALMAVDKYLADGYEFVTLSEMFYRRGIELEKGKIYNNAYPKSYGTDDGIAEPVISCVQTSGITAVSITGDSRGSVYYTVNGEQPTPVNAKLYNGSFSVEPGTTVKAVSVIKWNGLRSDVSMMTYTRNGHILTDVEADSWCCDIIDRAMTEGLFKGYTETRFCPDMKFSRSMLVEVLYRMSGSPETDSSELPFTDVPEDFWCRDAIAWAYENGIVNGYSDKVFAPRSDLSRQALCAMLARYMSFAGKDLSGVQTGTLKGFSDSSAVSKTLREDVDIICGLGIVMGYGDGTLRPTNGATRAQAAAMLLRMEDAMKTLPDKK